MADTLTFTVVGKTPAELEQLAYVVTDQRRNKQPIKKAGACGHPQVNCANPKFPTQHPIWDPKKNLPRTAPNPVLPGRPGKTGGSLVMVMLQDNNLTTPGLTIGLAVSGGQEPKIYGFYKGQYFAKLNQGLSTPETISVSVSRNAQTVLNIPNAKANPLCQTRGANRNLTSDFQNDVLDITQHPS